MRFPLTSCTPRLGPREYNVVQLDGPAVARWAALVEKVLAVELASMTPESGHAQIRRWIDYKYLDFADGYDASTRYRLWCTDM